MTKAPLFRAVAFCAAVTLLGNFSPLALAADKDKLLFDPADDAHVETITVEKAESAIVESGGAKVLQGTFPTGSDYPTLSIKPASGDVWDLSGKEGVEVEVTNKSSVTQTIAIRVDNAGDWKESPWNTESISVHADETVTLQVRFGFSNGGQPSFELDPAHIIAIKLFVVKPKETAVVQFKNLKPF